MQITYTSTNRAHHYPYAAALDRAGALGAFVTGFSRWSPRAALPELGDRLIRCDTWQNLYLAALRLPLPEAVSILCNRASNRAIDRRAFQPSAASDVFLYYRTTGHNTTRRLHAAGAPTLCVLEEVNSHVDECDRLMREEYAKLKLGPYPESFPDHELRLQAYAAADCILCPSSFVKRSFLARGFPEEKLLMVNFGFTLPEKTPAMPAAKTSDVFQLLYVGQIHFRKGLRYAVEAFRRLQHPRKELVLVGPQTKVTGLEGVSLPDGVRFAGVLKGADLEAAYASATAFVLPTVEEGLALVQGEAMAAGLPLITTTNSGGDDLITDGVEGFIVPPADPEALLDAFQKLADSPDLCQRMGQAAQAKARLLGGWDVAAGKLVAALGEAYERKFGEPPSAGKR
jgi:glycosyltransferase involved in cell wall biosynthesis